VADAVPVLQLVHIGHWWDTELTRERIVRTAIAVADAEGLAAVTMRRIARSSAWA
jgi:AcrR family transcriptional regulator